MKITKEVQTMEQIENVNFQIQELSNLITDLKMMRLATESMELLKVHKELYIYKASELLNTFSEKFYNIEQSLDDTAFYFQNLVEELEKQEGVFSYIVDNFNLGKKSHWTELTESEMKDVGSAANIAAVMAKMLNKKVA